MTDVSFSKLPFEVRDDIVDSHRSIWQKLAGPGSWWTGVERLALAAEARQAPHCDLCKENKQALSPFAADGSHDTATELPAACVDVVHRVVTDPSRLTQTWYQQKLDQGLSDASYVEIVSVVAMVVSVDSVCRGLGQPPHPLPQPQAGEPSRYRPAQATLGEAWVPMIPARGAVGPEKGLWGGGPPGNALRALSLVPDAVRDIVEFAATHYVPFDRALNPRVGLSISRPQIELVAGRVSALNECFY